MNPEDLVLTWLVERLENDTALSGMSNGVAPEAVWGTLKAPFIRIDRLEANDLMVIGLYRVWADCLFHVRGVFHWNGSGRPDRAEVDAIGGRIDELLHKVEDTTSSVQLHSFREEGTPDPAIVENGDLWLQSGGLYRVRARAV